MTTERQQHQNNAVGVENIALQELKAQYAQNDASMSKEMKDLYPVLNFRQMKERYPNEYLAFVATAPMFRSNDAQGRVMVHAPDSTEYDELLLAFHAEHPELPLSTLYTFEGPFKSPIDAILDYRIRKG